VPRYTERLVRCAAVLFTVAVWLWLIRWFFGYELVRLWRILVAFLLGESAW
jgi:hypothetical protein